MLIQVKRRDGKIETISIEPTAIVRHGGTLNTIKNPSGLEHFFTPDGEYDGWGQAVAEGTTIEQAQALMADTERHRSVS